MEDREEKIKLLNELDEENLAVHPDNSKYPVSGVSLVNSVSRGRKESKLVPRKKLERETSYRPVDNENNTCVIA